MENVPPPIEAASALPYGISSHSTPNFSTPLPGNAPNWPTGSKRLQLSLKQWEELKPTIQQLYIDEGKKFKEVALVLQTHHNFTPTKKQFDDKIKKWGLRKNATRSQRALILKELHNDDDMKVLKETSLKLNPGKLERWEREERLSGSLGKPPQSRNDVAVSTSKAALQRPPERALSPLRQMLDSDAASPDATASPKTIWDMANIPGSPNLRRFYSALKIDNDFPIPPPLRLPLQDQQFITQDQWSNIVKMPTDDAKETRSETSNVLIRSSTRQKQPTLSDLYICKWLLAQIERPWTPRNEVYPFPTTTKIHNARNGAYVIKLSPMKSLRLQIVESEGRLRTMEAVRMPDKRSSAGLVAEMNRLAGLYAQAGKYRPAESLCHRVALARQETLGPGDRRTLESYLDVIWLKRRQGQHSDAATLHRDLDPKIQKRFNPSYSVALRSRCLLADILYDLQKYDEAEMVGREILQITLNEFGQRHRRTLEAMRCLGEAMGYRKQYVAIEELLRTGLQLIGQVSGNDEEALYNNKLYLGRVLEQQGRNSESCSLLKDALRWSTSKYGMEHPTTLGGIFRLASSLRQNGQFEECELLLRRSFWRGKQCLGPAHQDTLFGAQEYARLMLSLGMWTEAASYYEQLFRGCSERNGLDHEITQWARKQLESSYAMQGLYKDSSALAAKLKGVVECNEDMRMDGLTLRRKYRQLRAGEVDEHSDEVEDEVEEVRPSKKRRVMTCTYNLKAAQG